MNPSILGFSLVAPFRSILSTETAEKVIIPTEAPFFYSKLHTLLIVLTAYRQVDLGGKNDFLQLSITYL